MSSGELLLGVGVEGMEEQVAEGAEGEISFQAQMVCGAWRGRLCKHQPCGVGGLPQLQDHKPGLCPSPSSSQGLFCHLTAPQLCPSNLAALTLATPASAHSCSDWSAMEGGAGCLLSTRPAQGTSPGSLCPWVHQGKAGQSD